eukprot:TRINITY_DN52_c0_g1_i1.p1 TRINITY_DN52_c0_g1~~TRINITY_DN52_c0_g1_i1.p1  ORF type:complete len:368 (+),score=87.66 TRINITY_DN52_c0_g1_i1:58-1161(+)
MQRVPLHLVEPRGEKVIAKEDESEQTNLLVDQNSKRDDDDEEDDLEYHAETVITVLKPVAITMLMAAVGVRMIESSKEYGGYSVSSSIAYAEQDSDSNGTKLWKSLVNALVVLVAILVTTVVFVVLYKYRCLKIIYGWLITASSIMLASFGGTFLYYFLLSWNIPMDYFTFFILLWNFSIVGILSIFWHGATKVNQGFLIVISALLAIFFSRFPEWTTFAILIVIALYDIVAVLSPCGPLKMLVETAQQRQEPIPALLYNASAFIMMADTDDEPIPSKRKGVKLGLGDFIFYSVLIGRAALFDVITIITSFIGIITGLFLTLLLLAIFRKALPALPISIALGVLFYLITRIFLLPFVIVLGRNQIFV